MHHLAWKIKKKYCKQLSYRWSLSQSQQVLTVAEQSSLLTSESWTRTLKCTVIYFNQHKMELLLKIWTSPLMQFMLLFPTFISCIYGPFPHKQQDSFSQASPLILFAMRPPKHVEQEKRMEENWEWRSSWRQAEQDFFFQWQCQFKQDNGICCYLVVSPDKVTRSCRFPYKSWAIGDTYFLCQLSLCVFSTTERKHIWTILRKPIFLNRSRWPWTL